SNVEKLQVSGGSWTLDGSSNAWEMLLLDGGDLILDGANLTVGEIVGAIIAGDTITNIAGRGSNLYYDKSLAANAYLNGGVFNLVGGGVLAPVSVPEPRSIALVLSGLALLTLTRRRSRR